ncbi:ferrous iron transport protein B [Candidatus Bathyarchaeota archaeon]|nr:MAG: ferrous iron transport protein B [Candidatus Bathyarchaeota archaeon]
MSSARGSRGGGKKVLRIALAGNANVGKSALFNQLTGLNQTVGNWPGKTVERAEGTLYYKGHKIRVLDLPGIYSLSAYSQEELVAREYIAVEKPDVVVDVVDASALERNLYLTLQLMELEAPLVVCLNQVDFAARRGIRIDHKALSELLGVPVVPTVAITGKGLEELLEAVIAVAEGKAAPRATPFEYKEDVEKRIQELAEAVEEQLDLEELKYPARWIAIKLLERDPEVERLVSSSRGGKAVLELARQLATELEESHGTPSPVVIASERYAIASLLAKAVSTFTRRPRLTLEEKLDAIACHRVLGYALLAVMALGAYALIFGVGDIIAGLMEDLFNAYVLPYVSASLSPSLPDWALDIICDGLLGGLFGGLVVVLPYLLPLYVLIALLEDSGYLPRAACLMDPVMHKIGLHGKAFIPLMLGFGCNVPACVGCRVMETDRERTIAGLTVVLVPCSARTVIIMGLVARYAGLWPALALYALDLALIFAAGRTAYKLLPGEPVGLIMEMPPYRRPMLKSIAIKTWVRLRSFVLIALPLIVLGSLFLEALDALGLVWPIVDALAPITSGWLLLPPEAGFPLIFGFLRKELVITLLVDVAGGDPASLMEPGQMFVFSFVSMVYVPCVATIAALVREFGWKKALLISLASVLLAFVLGGLMARLLVLLGWL